MFVLENGATLTPVDRDGYTVLHWAAYVGHLQVVVWGDGVDGVMVLMGGVDGVIGVIGVMG